MRNQPSKNVTARLVALAGLIALLQLVALTWIGSLAKAQGLDDAVASLDVDGYWLEPGTEANRKGYEKLVDDAQGTDLRWFFITLLSPAENGNSTFANEVYSETTDVGSVIVVSPTDGGFDIAVVSSPNIFSIEDIDEALDSADADLSASGGTALDRHRRIFDTLAEFGPGDSVSYSIPALLVAGSTILLAGGVWRSRRS